MGVIHKNPFWRDWMQMDIHCNDDNWLFLFPEDIEDKEERKEVEELGKSICKGCPALRPCLSYAIDTDTRYGIFGGKTYKERKAYDEQTNQG